jgi:hypothetical protein
MSRLARAGRSPRPIGQPTRGKTALNRLRQIDIYVALRLESLLRGGSPLIVDVGYGAYAWTALEMVERLGRINAKVRLLGLEIDPQRVEAAQYYVDPPRLDFRLGGFNVTDALNGERARLIRCYNVLRQYDEAAVVPALQQMADGLEPGGVLIEGTSNPSGRLVAFDVYQNEPEGLLHRALVFGTNFRAPVEAVDFQAILPKRLIHHMRDDSTENAPISPARFFADWQREWVLRRVPDQVAAPRPTWIAVGEALLGRYPISRHPGLLRRGYLELRTALLA